MRTHIIHSTSKQMAYHPPDDMPFAKADAQLRCQSEPKAHRTSFSITPSISPISYRQRLYHHPWWYSLCEADALPRSLNEPKAHRSSFLTTSSIRPRRLLQRPYHHPWWYGLCFAYATPTTNRKSNELHIPTQQVSAGVRSKKPNQEKTLVWFLPCVPHCGGIVALGGTLGLRAHRPESATS